MRLRFLPLLAFLTPGLKAQNCLTLSMAAAPGGATSLELSLNTSTDAPPAALQWTFRFWPSVISSLTVRDGPAVIAAGKGVMCAPSPTGYLCLAVGANANAIGSGVIANITIALPLEAASQTVQLMNLLAASASGYFVPICNRSGIITARFSQIGTFRPSMPVGAALGVFEFDANGNNEFDSADKLAFFGLAGDIPVAGDWDGTGSVRLGVFRCPASGVCQWYIDMNNNGQWDGTSGGDAIWNFGLAGDQPVVGDWKGLGLSSIGVMRCPAAGQPGVCTWYLDLGYKHTYDPATVGTYAFGLPGDKPVAGPFAPNSGVDIPVDTIGVFRCPAMGVCQWYVDTIGQTSFSTPAPQNVVTGAIWNFGLPGDQPVVGNWNNTGAKRIGIFRNAGGMGQWFVDTNGNHVFDPGIDQVFNFGLAGDQALVGFWTLP